MTRCLFVASLTLLSAEAGVAPRLLQHQQELQRQQLEARLGKHLAARPAREDLIARHIIAGTLSFVVCSGVLPLQR